MITLKKTYELEANVTRMSTVKNRQSFFFKFGKQQRVQNTIKKLFVDDREATDQTYILNRMKHFYETLV